MADFSCRSGRRSSTRRPGAQELGKQDAVVRYGVLLVIVLVLVVVLVLEQAVTEAAPGY